MGDGTLTLKNIENMIPLIDINWNSSSKTKLFDPPCDFIKFLAKIQSSSSSVANNILDKLLSYIHLKIQDVFNIFCENNDIMNETQIKLMYNYAYKKESDWRTTFKFPCNLSSFIENWSTMGIYEQHGIFDETEKRIIKRIKKIFELININNTNNNYKLFNNNNTPLSFDKFIYGINLLHRSLTNDILPILENYIDEQNPKDNQHEEEKEENGSQSEQLINPYEQQSI